MAELNIADFGGGLNLTAAIDKLPDRECLLADACSFDELGNVSCTGATTKQNSSSYTSAAASTNIHSLYVNSTVRQVAGVGKDVFSGTALGSLTSLSATVNATPSKMSFTELLNRVYFDVDGTARWVDSSGNTQTVDWPPPGAATAALNAAAGNLNGTYTWKITFVDSTGLESDGGTASGSVVTANQQADLSAIPTGDSRTAKRYVYRKGGTLTFYYKVATIADNTTTTLTDNYADTSAITDGIILAGDVSGDLSNTRLGSSTLVKYPAVYYDRYFWANQASGSKNQILWSKVNHPFAYPATSFNNIGDGKPVTRLVPFLEDLIIFKTDSIWRLQGSDEDTFNTFRTPSTAGCDMPFTIVKLQDRIMFTNTQGIWFFDGLTSRPATNRLDLFFLQQSRNGISPISLSTAGLHEAVATKQKYYLAYSDNATANNKLLTIDLKNGTIARQQLACISIASDPVTGFVYSGDASGFVKRIDDFTSSNESGSAVTWAFQTKYFDPIRGSNKQFSGIEFDIDTGGQSLTPTVYYNDGSASEILSTISSSGRSRVLASFASSTTSRKARNISIKLAASLSTVFSSSVPAVKVYGFKIFYDVREQRSRVS